LLEDGGYARVPAGETAVRSQMVLLEAARRGAQARAIEPVIRHAAAPDVAAENIRAAAAS
jgi:polyphosphate kinase